MTGHPGEAPLDGWSIVHVLGGAAVGIIVRNAWVALGLVLAYEVFEGALRRVKRGDEGKGLFEYESWTNIRHDVVFGMTGWLFAQGAPDVDLPVPWL